MLKQATYCNGERAATVRLERLDALLKSETEVLCFPRPDATIAEESSIRQGAGILPTANGFNDSLKF